MNYSKKKIYRLINYCCKQNTNKNQEFTKLNYVVNDNRLNIPKLEKYKIFLRHRENVSSIHNYIYDTPKKFKLEFRSHHENNNNNPNPNNNNNNNNPNNPNNVDSNEDNYDDTKINYPLISGIVSASTITAAGSLVAVRKINLNLRKKKKMIFIDNSIDRRYVFPDI